jgi:uncharacterized membrane protein
MRNLLVAFAAAGLALAPLGCDQGPQGGNSGTKDSFTLNPSLGDKFISPTIKKGETKEIDLALKADSAFKGKVNLKAEHPDKMKTELNPSSVDLTPGSDVKVRLMVTNDGAAAGDQTIKVTATPDHGSAITREVKVKAE